jgi:hypothetical protein
MQPTPTMRPGIECPNHRPVVVFVTHTNWHVVQCLVCGAGDVVLPPGVVCGYEGCKDDHERKEL